MSSAKRKPARVQVDPDSIDADGKPVQTGTIFNVWYSKWAGGDSNDLHLQTHSKTRVNIKLDSGYTRADKLGAGSSTTPLICLYFARGSCCMGKKCEYLHRLPTDDDNFPVTIDCFGRDKYLDYRDDMGGVGNFNKTNRTLYIGRINNINDENIEFKIAQNFKEFGDIDKIRVVHNKNVAFVSYKNELNAQFLKEAMAHQSLDKGNENEILNIRWANDDPDPALQRRNKRKLEQETMEKVRQMLGKLENEQGVENVENVEDVEDVNEHIEVPVEDQTLQNDTKTQQKRLKTESDSLLGGSGAGALQMLRQLKALKQKKEPLPLQSSLQSVMNGYESSDDE